MYRKKSPAERAEERGFYGIKTTKNGGPDFSETDYIKKLDNGTEMSTKIKMTGTRRDDFKEANKQFWNFWC